MELITYRVPWTDSLKPVVIAPLGDIQYAGKNGPTAKDLLHRHIDKAMRLDAWFVGLGDFIDFLSPSNRQRLRAAALYDTSEDVIDEKALELVHDLFEKFLKPTKGRWCGLVSGHHYAQMRAGDTSDMRLAQLLDTTFLGTSGFVRLQFVKGKKAAQEHHCVVMFVHHGAGGTGKNGAALNKLEGLSTYWGGADIFLMGHTTKESVAPINRVHPRWTGTPNLEHRKIYIINTGGFSKGYVVGARQGQVPHGGYVEEKMLNPAMLGAPFIKIVPRVVMDAGQQQWAPDINVEI